MVGDGERGAILEQLLSKILFLSPSTQIVGMTATIGNLASVGCWLRAITYTTTFRPVPLRQMVPCPRADAPLQLIQILGVQIKIGSYLFDERGRRLRQMGTETSDIAQMLPFITEVSQCRPFAALVLNVIFVLQVVPHHSVLVFCPTKRQTEVSAKGLAGLLPSPTPQLRYGDVSALGWRIHSFSCWSLRQDRDAIVQRLKAVGGGDSLLALTLPAGVAYHHSGKGSLLASSEFSAINYCTDTQD